ncbi:helix-turn-helix transcriptional regulator [Paenibacillus mesophilus]|uniref:helix-turn-helix transcriptional regulator n=1 Tax=Paenibacillus mesophilus TaxID=2582849 RepID=UPI00110EC661|nr:helix-turn-helix transcriptional regulator [Paenibacillus mesophilus]TMV45302.1 helix-turn-helix transcriptional regulator [Paenibacillus mesophilus]
MAKAYIDDHIDEDISPARLSATAGLPTHYVSKQFMELHVSFVDFLQTPVWTKGAIIVVCRSYPLGRPRVAKLAHMQPCCCT